MARFYDPLPASQTPDWSKASKEPDRVRPNTAAGDALKNFAGIFEDAISGWDSIQKERNYETASKGEDQIYQDATKKNMDILTGTGPVAGTADDPGGMSVGGVTGTPATATNTPGTGDPRTQTEDSIVPSASPLPVAVQAKVDTTKTELARLDAAQQSGRMSHIEVMAKRDALRRNLLAQNPGYRKEIQAALGDTANQLYRATQEEVMRREAEVGAQKNKLDQQLWQERASIAIDNPDLIQNPDKYTDQQKREALQTGVQYSARLRAQEIEKAQIAHDILTGNPRDNVSRMKQNLNNYAEFVYNTEIRKMYAKFGFKDENDFKARVEAMRLGKANSEDVQKMMMFADDLKGTVETQVRNYAGSVIAGSSYRFTDILKDEDIKNAVANVGAKADAFRTAIVNKETGLIEVYARVEKTQQDEYNRRVMEKIPTMRIYKGMREIFGGGEALSTVLTQSGPEAGGTWLGQMTKEVELMGKLATMQIATGTAAQPGGDKPTASQMIDQNFGHIGPSANPATSATRGQIAASNEKKVATGKLLDDIHRMILDPKMPTEIAMNSAGSIFRDNVILSRVKDDERGAFLRKFTSNEVRDRMWALSQKDPQAWTDYRDWVDRHLNTNMNAAAQSIREKHRDGWLSPNSNIGIRYNPEAKQVEVYQKTPLPEGPTGPNEQSRFHQAQQAQETVRESLQKGLEPLNENLRALGGVWEKEKKDITPEMLQRLAVLGIEVPGQQNIGPEQNPGSVLPDGTKLPGPALGAPGSPAGAVPAQPGTPGTTEAPIDAQKPQIANADGSVSTERTITIEGKDGGWVNIPTIVGGKQLTNEQAEALYLRGRNNPVGEGFATAQEAAQAAQARSNQIGQQLPPKPPAPFSVTDPNVAATARGEPIPRPGRTDAGVERQRQQMLQERQQEQQRRALPGTPGGGNEVPIPRPRPANQPQPRDYTGIKLPYDVPPFAGSLLKGEIEKAGVWDRLPKALQDKVTKGATTWGGWQITKQDLDSLPQDVWEKLGERLGGTPGKRSEQSIPVQTMAYMGHLEDQPELLAQMTNTEAPKSQSVNAQVFSIATEYKGFHEKVHRQVLSDFMTGATGTKVNPATTPWCAGFANAVLANAGVKGPGGLSARAFLQWGTPTNEPKQGDVVVISRGRDPTKGHVGFFAGMDGDRVKILAGNQGDAVTIRSFPAKSVLGYRRVKESDIRSFKTSMESSEELNTTAYAAGSPQDDIAEQVAEVTAPIAGALAPGGVDRIVQGETPSTNVEDRTQSDPGRDAMLARIEKIRRDPSLSASEKKNEIDGLMAGSPGRQVAPSVAAEYQRTRDRALERSDLAEELKRGL
jgi:uncharacterized protein (TIGR02594 family)